MLRAVRPGLVYGTLSFAAGIALGTARELMLIPRLGEAFGRVVEFPLVTLAAVLIAWWLVRRARPVRPAGVWLAVGVVGVVTLLAFESALALLVLRVPLEDYLTGFDIRAGALFPLGLAIMLVAPAGVAVLGRR